MAEAAGPPILDPHLINNKQRVEEAEEAGFYLVHTRSRLILHSIVPQAQVVRRVQGLLVDLEEMEDLPARLGQL